MPRKAPTAYSRVILLGVLAAVTAVPYLGARIAGHGGSGATKTIVRQTGEIMRKDEMPNFCVDIHRTTVYSTSMYEPS